MSSEIQSFQYIINLPLTDVRSLKSSPLRFLGKLTAFEFLSYLPIIDIQRAKGVSNFFATLCRSTPGELCEPLQLQLRSQNSIIGSEIDELITTIAHYKDPKEKKPIDREKNLKIAAKTVARACPSHMEISIDLSRVRETQLFFEFFPFSSTRKLKISNVSYERKNLNLSLFPRFPSLRQLYITGDSISLGGAFATTFPRLTDLKLPACTLLTNQNIKEMDGLRLKHLNLAECNRITKDGLIHVTNFNKLQTLDLSNSSNITDREIQSIQGVYSLTYLDLSFCQKISDKALLYVKKLFQLSVLFINNCPNISDVGLKHIRSLINLSGLAIGNCTITLVGLEHLKHLVYLTSLDIRCCDFRKGDFGVLRNFPRLTQLDMRNTKVNNATLIILSSLHRLQNLYLSTPHSTRVLPGTVDATSITDAGMPYLASMTQLQHLRLRSPLVTDIGLKQLMVLINLKSLDVEGCRNITPTFLINMKKNPHFKYLIINPDPTMPQIPQPDSRIEEFDNCCVIS